MDKLYPLECEVCGVPVQEDNSEIKLRPNGKGFRVQHNFDCKKILEQYEQANKS